jgi:glycosyltransferase involved in cell wall biosynthesis
MTLRRNHIEVSVRIVTYNHKKWIGQCLDSVIQQETEFDFEIIVGVDVSTDNTLQLVREYAEKYPDMIRVLEHKDRKGPFLNAKLSLHECCGDYIAFMNGDDFWQSPLKLQKQVSFLRDNPDYGIVHSDCDILYQKNKKTKKTILRDSYKILPEGKIYEELLQNNFIHTSTTLVRKELLDRFDNYDFYMSQGFKMGDYPRWIEISRHSKIGYIDDSFTTYRVLEDSQSHSSDLTKQLEFAQSIHAVRNYYIKKYGCSEVTQYNVDYNYLRRILMLTSLISQRDMARQTYNKLKTYNLDLIERIKLKLYLLGSYFKFAGKFMQKFIRA